MAYEQRDNSGSVFKNSRRDRDNSPDLTGTAKVFGRDMWVNAWEKTDKNGDKWVSFSFKEKVPRQEVDTRPTQDAIDDSVPF